jgi:uncharacterized membrane protein
MGADLYYVIKWWLYILILGWALMPAASRAFAGFYDTGYLFSKTLGILSVSYLVWLFSAVKVLPFAVHTIWLFTLAIAFFVYKRLRPPEFFKILRRRWAAILCEESMFLVGLVFWAYLRGIQPDIYGLEKFMDLGFINSILNSGYMPPPDMWLAGSSINYYYFGQFIGAVLMRFSQVESSIGFNLMLATIFSLSFWLIFSVVSNLTCMCGKKAGRYFIAAGLISALLLTFGGNLHTVIYGIIMPASKSLGLYDGAIEDYWYPQATRYIGYNPPTEDKLIHEFPAYSIVVSDLHAHIVNMPFVITFLALILAYVGGGFCGRLGGLGFLVFPWMLGIFQMGNAWDFPIYLTVLCIAVGFRNLSGKDSSPDVIVRTILQALIAIAGSFIVSMPFMIGFRPFFNGVFLVHSQSPLYQMAVLWGYQLFFIASFFLLLVYERVGLKPLIDAPRGVWGRFRAFLSGFDSSDSFALCLSICAVWLILVPETVYIKDIYIDSYYRANTVFKFIFQASILFAIVTGYAFARLAAAAGRGVWGFTVATVLLIVVAMPMVYPYYSISGYFGSLRPSNYKGLDGIAFLEKMHPGDLDAIRWIRGNAQGQSVVLEADGDSYSSYGRISVVTGHPTLLGWFVHEWLWRNNVTVPSERSAEVRAVYEYAEEGNAMSILGRYNVTYIVIGELEKKRFTALNETMLGRLGPIVYDNQKTRVIRVQYPKVSEVKEIMDPK